MWYVIKIENYYSWMSNGTYQIADKGLKYEIRYYPLEPIMISLWETKLYSSYKKQECKKFTFLLK